MGAKWVSVLVLVLSIWATDCGPLHGHVPAPAPSVDCSNLIMEMADCLSFVSNGSSVSKPEGNCCSGIGNVLRNGPECICEGFKSSVELGVVLNMTKAISLPDTCKLPHSKATDCGLTETPAAAPGSSPTGGVVVPSPASSSKSSGSSKLSVSSESIAIGAATIIVYLFSF